MEAGAGTGQGRGRTGEGLQTGKRPSRVHTRGRGKSEMAGDTEGLEGRGEE